MNPLAITVGLFALASMGTGPTLSDLDKIALMTLQGTPQNLASLTFS